MPKGGARPFHGLYVALVGFFVLAYLAAVVQNGVEAKRKAETRMLNVKSTLVQSTRTALKNYELVLRGVGSELVALGALQSPSRGRELIERMESIDPGMAGFGLARPAETLALLKGMGCDQAQGYHLSRPLPLDRLIAWLAAR